MHDKSFCKIIPLGNHLHKRFSNSIRIKKAEIGAQLDTIIARDKPDAILTYNKNGSGYAVKRDNISMYRWAEDAISRLDVPKFHVTTDYCRSGFREEQAKWFEDLGYTAAIFRHRESSKYPCPVDKFVLPFSVDAGFYSKFNSKPYTKKSENVAFLGSSFNSPVIYSKRIAAINLLGERGLISTSRVCDKSTGQTQMILGEGYHRFLSKHMFGLTCGGTCNYMTAKYFQIPALQSMLVCSDTNGLDLFPDDTYIKFSENNIEKLYEDIRYFIKNKKEARERVMTLHRYVIRNHSHSIRASQLISFIKSKI